MAKVEKVGKPIRILVGRVRRGRRGEYVGRPSPLGNPYRLKKEEDRQRVITSYRGWLQREMRERNPAILKELGHLVGIAKRQGEVRLTCWCAPLPCHAEVVAEVLRRVLEEEGYAVRVEVEGR